MLPENPFKKLWIEHCNSMLDIKCEWPYLPWFVKILIALTICVVLAFLYVIVGTASQISDILNGLIAKSIMMMKQKPFLGKGVHLIFIGILTLVWLPFRIIGSPTWVLGALVATWIGMSPSDFNEPPTIQSAVPKQQRSTDNFG
jgi:hypothetical protein